MRWGVDDAGPSVQTIFARGMTPRSKAQLHTRARGSGLLKSEHVSYDAGRCSV
jgi:hypothetical protein